MNDKIELFNLIKLKKTNIKKTGFKKIKMRELSWNSSIHSEQLTVRRVNVLERFFRHIFFRQRLKAEKQMQKNNNRTEHHRVYLFVE